MSSERQATTPAQATLLTAPFVLLCLTVLLGYAHQALMTPTVPLYVTDHGGSALAAGLVLLTFSIPSVVVRPFLGHLSDVWSATGVLTVGLLLLAFGGALFLIPFFAVLVIASVIRGLGWAGINTGGYALLAEVAPPTRRGEAAGYYASITTSATIIFPALALWLLDFRGGGFPLVFLIAALISAVGVPVSHLIMRPLIEVEPKTPSTAMPDAPAVKGGVDSGILLAMFLNLSTTLAYPAITAFLPLYAREMDIGNVGLFYVLSGITSVFIRPLLGRKSDSIGRGPSIAIGLSSFIIGVVCIVLASSLPLILIGGVFTAVGGAISSSAATALALDLANPASRGKAMGTFSMSFQIGNGFGSVLAGAIADFAGYRGMYVGSIAIVGAGLVLLALSWKSLSRASAAAAQAA